MATEEDMLLSTTEARTFVSTIQNPAQTGPAPAQACAGGVPSCGHFVRQLDWFLKDAAEFLGKMDQGINGYRDVTTACYLDYDDNDVTKAERITETMQVETGDLSDKLRSTGQGWTEDPR
jgi:hypothetical protein